MVEEGQLPQAPAKEDKTGSTTFHLPSNPNFVLRQLMEAHSKQQWKETPSKGPSSSQPPISTSNQFKPLDKRGWTEQGERIELDQDQHQGMAPLQTNTSSQGTG